MIPTLEVKYDSKNTDVLIPKNKSSTIKTTDAHKEESGSNISLYRVPSKNKKFMTVPNMSIDATYKSMGIQSYCILFQNASMDKVKYT